MVDHAFDAFQFAGIPGIVSIGNDWMGGILQEVPVSSCVPVPAPVGDCWHVPEDTVDGLCCTGSEVEVAVVC